MHLKAEHFDDIMKLETLTKPSCKEIVGGKYGIFYQKKQRPRENIKRDGIKGSSC